MEAIGWFLLYLFVSALGFIVQYILRGSPWIILVFSFLVVLVLPPLWALGLIVGLWICCAFFTFHPETERLSDGAKSFAFYKVLLSSILTFLGFVLTLFFLWRVKTYSVIELSQREMLGWSILILIEVCILKIIARICPVLYRKYLGFGITILNFVMIFYSIISLGFVSKLLVFVVLLNINLFILVLVDQPVVRTVDPLLRK